MSEEIPQDRCGYTWNPDDIEAEHQNCCYRENWQDYDRCVWHADTENKPAEELQSQRETQSNRSLNRSKFERDSEPRFTPAELLDGAILYGIENINLSRTEGAKFNRCFLRDADFSDADVYKSDFSRSNIERADFSGFDVTLDATFEGANMAGANLSNASLTDSNLEEANLEEANLSDANLYDSDLSGANLAYAELTGTALAHTNISYASMFAVDASNVLLKNANLSHTNLMEANLSDGTLDEVDFSESLLAGANLSDAALRDINLSDTKLGGVDFSDSLLMGAKLTHAEGSCDFSGASLHEQLQYSGADLRDSELENSDFSGANLSSTDFSRANLDGSDFSNSNPEDVDFSETSIREGKFTQTELTNTDFSHADVSESDFRDADLVDASFFCANLERAKLTGADLFGADLSGAQFYASRIGDVAINTETVLDQHGGHRCAYDPNSEYGYDSDEKEKTGQLQKAMGAYHVLEQLTRANTLPDEQAKFFARRQDMRRAQLREDGQRLEYWFAEAQNAVFRHGESFSRVVAWAVGTIVAFALLYPIGGWLQSESTGAITYSNIADSPLLLWKSLHHSALLFLTGSGPLTPTGTVGELLVTIEAITAPVLLALLVFVLGRRAAR